MSSIIAASVFIPLMIIMATVVVDKLEQNAEQETGKKDGYKNKKGRNEPPDDLIDLSGGTYGI